MATAREIKRRITSVKNIAQVTRALEAVSASKVRKAQAQAMNSRSYSAKAWEIMLNLSAASGVTHPLLEAHEELKSVDIILITSDRSLCGAYNNNIIRVAERFALSLGLEKQNIRWITIGRKGRDYLVRQGYNVIAEFSKLPPTPDILDINAAGQLAINDYLSGIADKVFIAYTDFINTLRQYPRIFNLLPMQHYEPENRVQAEYIKEEPDITSEGRDYLYEPGPELLLDELVPRFTVMEVYQALLESLASEHSARMIAMRNASESAVALAEDLTLEYNKARQMAITAEILDIVGGVAALENSEDNNRSVQKADRFINEVGGALQAEKQMN